MVTGDIDGIRRPTLDGIAARQIGLAPYLNRTPVFQPGAPSAGGASLEFKFECLQVSGTFKARGAFSNLLALDGDGRIRHPTCELQFEREWQAGRVELGNARPRIIALGEADLHGSGIAGLART